MVPESEFTSASDWCPHPERWHATDGDSAETEVTELVCSFVRALRPDIVVETGSAWGNTSFAIGTVLAEAGVGELFTTEVDMERVKATRLKCAGLPVRTAYMSSLEFHLQPVDVIGFAWFDSLLDLRVPEFRHYRKWMVPGTIVGFHDVGEHRGPHRRLGRQIERELVQTGMLRTIRLRTPRGVLFGEVL